MCIGHPYFVSALKNQYLLRSKRIIILSCSKIIRNSSILLKKIRVTLILIKSIDL